jgi:short-subunit dehydrogenase
MRSPVVILGATSALGQAFARAAAARGKDVVLCARDEDEALRSARDLEVRFGVEAAALGFEAIEDSADPLWFARLCECCGGSFEGLFLAYGAMFEESEARADPELAARMITTNLTSPAQVLERAAARLESAGAGWICVVSSVAGDRGRASNYLYGASKAGLQALLSGLRARLASSGVRCVDVRPGFVDTPLTWGRPGVFLAASPERVARDALRAIDRDRAIVYTPYFWRAIMTVIRWLPDAVFKRLSL